MISWAFLAILLGSARALLAGTLPLRYCTTRFASRIPALRFPVSGHAACLVTADLEVSGACGNEVSREVHWVHWVGWSRTEKNSTKQKTPRTPRGVHDSFSSTGLEEVASCGTFQCFHS